MSSQTESTQQGLFQQLANSQLYLWKALADRDQEQAISGLASAIYASRRTGPGEDQLLMEIYETIFKTKELPPQS